MIIFSVQYILQLLEHSCLVLVTSPYDNYTEILSELSTNILRPNRFPFGALDPDAFKHDKYISIKMGLLQQTQKQLPDSAIVVLDKLVKDRSCILAPPPYKELKGDVLKLEEATNSSLLDLVNSRCDSYFAWDGSLNVAGMHNEYIMQNLFSLSAVENSVTMQQLVCEIGPDLKHRFYDGLRGEQCVHNLQCNAYNMEQCAIEAQLSEIPECSEVDGFLSADEFRQDYLFRSKPVIFKRALFNHPWTSAMRTWTSKMFREKYGSKNVSIMLAPKDGLYEGVESTQLWKDADQFMQEMPEVVRQNIRFKDLVLVRPAIKQMSLDKFLDLIESAHESMSAYLEYTSVREYFQELIDQFPEFPMADELSLDHFNIWLSDGNTLGKLHFDQFDNFLAQLSGRKQLTLYAPYNNSRLYEGHIVEAHLQYSNGTFYRNDLRRSTALNMAPVDITRPNLERFPLFSDARPLNCTISEGDVLYLPSFWWHEVQSYPSQKEKRNLAVNFWYDPFFQREFPCADSECKLFVSRKYKHWL